MWTETAGGRSNAFNLRAGPMKKSFSETLRIAKEGENAADRREALIELGYRKDPSLYPFFVQKLDDPSSSIVHAAVLSLGRHGNAAAIQELTKPKIFHSPVVNIRWAAVAALTQLGDHRVIEPLLRAAEDDEWIIRNQAVAGLKEKIKEIIAARDLKYARFLIRLLALDDSEIVALAIGGFTELGDQSVDLLVEALESPSQAIRKNAAVALGKIGSEKAVMPLAARLSDEDWEVRRNAVEALGILKDERAVEPLVLCLGDHAARVQNQTIHDLAAFGRNATPSLLNALEHEKDKFTLRAIIETLGEIRDPNAVQPLLGQLRNRYFVVRNATVRALVRYGASLIDSLLPMLSFNPSNIRSLLRDASAPGDPLLQLRSVNALRGLEDCRALPLLKKLSETGGPAVREAAASAEVEISLAVWGRCGVLAVLRETGDSSLAPRLAGSLKDDSSDVRLEAVRTLGKWGGDKAVELLIRTAKEDRDEYVRAESIRHLRGVGVGFKKVLDLALNALNDRAWDVRAQATRLLGNFQDARSIQPLLLRTADPNWSVRESAENALMNFGSSAVAPLIEALKSRSWTTRFRAARLLGEIGDRRAVSPLEAMLARKGEKKEVREVIGRSLGKLKGNSS